MTKQFTVVGLDPSMNNFGIVKATYFVSTGKFKVQSMWLSESPDHKDKKTVRQNSKDIETAKHHFKTIQAWVSGADLVVAEVPVGSQSSRAMASYGICIGLLASISKPFIQVTPTEVKMCSVGSKTATKQEMIDWAVKNHPEAEWLTEKRKGVTCVLQKNEHLADAIAALYAAAETPEFKFIANVLTNE